MYEDMRRTAGPRINAHSTGISVQVEQHVKDKMEGWCNVANGEVSGLFLVRKLSNSVFYVYDVFLPEQNGSTGFTKINGYATGRLYGYLQKKYGLEGMGDLKGWWHTHYTFGTFWSGTDDNTAQQNAHLAQDWSLSIVINQAGSWLSRVDIVDPVRVMIDELPITFVPNKTKHSKRDYARDVARWVSPFPAIKSKKVAVWNTKSITIQEDRDPTHVNYAGMMVPMESLNQILSCPCGDATCIDCKDIINQIKQEVNHGD